MSTTKQLVITATDARKFYKSASPELKAVFETTFGKVYFSEKITDRVKTLDDACEVLGINVCWSSFSDLTRDELAYKKLKVIVAALNEGWAPDWDNCNQYKYFPWFKLEGGFSLNYVCVYYSRSLVGSRLCFRSRELAEYAATQFQTLYQDLLTA